MRTRSPSEGSFPLIAPALAAVRLSTSSRPTDKHSQNRLGKEMTNHHDNKRVLVVYHLVHRREELLNELAGLREPLREEGMRVDFDDLSISISGTLRELMTVMLTGIRLTAARDG